MAELDTAEHLSNAQTPTSPDQNNNNESRDSQLDSSNQETQNFEQALVELDKLERFKFNGKEYTPQDLKKDFLRQQDYTKKTQALARQREQYEQAQEDKKFATNFVADLRKVYQNPSLEKEFYNIYPVEYHEALKDALEVLRAKNGESSGQNQNQSQSVVQQKSQQIDPYLAHRIDKIEKSFHEQEVAKNQTMIDSDISKFSQKYKYANTKEVVANLFETISAGAKYSAELVEQSFKISDKSARDLAKRIYSEQVKEQTSANNKARDVDSGGGTVGRAPRTFKSISEATKQAAEDLSRRRQQ